jgi:polyphosphate kinase
MTTISPRYFNRDLSWLQFNERVLAEAGNAAVPLYERIRFLSIFSSNLDEFFRVRYPVLAAQNILPETAAADKELLLQIQQEVNRHQQTFGRILTQELLPALLEEQVHVYYSETLQPQHTAFVRNLFYTRLAAYLQPVVLDAVKPGAFFPQNNMLYFLVQLKTEESLQYAMLNIPHDSLSRFLQLPSINGVQQLLFLDDAVRYNAEKMFPGTTVTGCYSIKITRSADINLSDEWSEAFETEVEQMIKAREDSLPSRFLYEYGMPEDVKTFVRSYFRLTDAELIEGGRYHNLKDLASLPEPQGRGLSYPPMPPLVHPALSKYDSVLEAVATEDILINLPYQAYDHILRFFNEAAIDPDVQEIFVTLYRVAADSQIAHTLISAAKNGKKVTAFVELKARFDEANNLNWAKKMKAAGIRIVYSIPGMKVHAKLALVKRKRGWKSEYIALLATGNFNERTARFYTDHVLMTSDKSITTEVDLLFAYLVARTPPKAYPFLQFKELLVAGFNMVDRFRELVMREVAHKQAGREAHIIIKLNGLEEQKMIDLLYEAGNAGVRIELIVRGICCLVPGVPGMSENITVHRIVDRYLEHARVFIFHNDGNEEVYLGSADWMNRNLHRRIEVVFPVHAPALKKQVQEIIDLQLADNVQARVLDANGDWHLPEATGKTLAAQTGIYEELSQLLQKTSV